MPHKLETYNKHNDNSSSKNRTHKELINFYGNWIKSLEQFDTWDNDFCSKLKLKSEKNISRWKRSLSVLVCSNGSKVATEADQQHITSIRVSYDMIWCDMIWKSKWINECVHAYVLYSRWKMCASRIVRTFATARVLFVGDLYCACVCNFRGTFEPCFNWV